MDIDGDLTAQAEAILMDGFTDADTPGASAVILNFTGLTYANGAASGCWWQSSSEPTVRVSRSSPTA
jgi:hypothetical protein